MQMQSAQFDWQIYYRNYFLGNCQQDRLRSTEAPLLRIRHLGSLTLCTFARGDY